MAKPLARRMLERKPIRHQEHFKGITYCLTLIWIRLYKVMGVWVSVWFLVVS